MIIFSVLQATNNMTDLFLAMALMFWSFIQIFLFCELGEMLTGQFNKLNDAIFERDWYTFPIEIQRKLPMITMGIRLPVVISGYGNIRCTRQVCQNVLHVF